MIVGIDIVKGWAEAAGSYWFKPDTMRFFRCRVAQCAYSGDGHTFYFVSSEKGPGMARAYTVRKVIRSPWDISDVGGFQAYKSRSGADYAARRLAETDAHKQSVEEVKP